MIIHKKIMITKENYNTKANTYKAEGNKTLSEWQKKL